jgi:hypothetical protein
MFGSSIIDIAIGMVFIYLLLSLICSAASEIIERYSRRRARDLENGIKEMFQSQDLVKSLYEHPLVYSLFAKPYSPGAKTLPSYIPARNFALALMDLVGEGGAQGATGPGARGAIITLRATIEANTTLTEPVKKALITFVDSSPHPENVRQNIENWFDSAMDRVSGVYKRRTQLINLSLGLFIAILLNVNTVTLVRTLSSDRALRDSLVAAAQEYAKSNPLPSPSPSPSVSPTPAAKASNSPSPKPSPTDSPATASPRESPTDSVTTASPTTSATALPVAAASPTESPTASATTASPATSATTPPVAGTSPSPSPSPDEKCTADTPECRVKNNLKEIKELELPIGWGESVRNDFKTDFWTSLALSLIGWMITALAVSLGAPFWFDLLNKFIVIRGTVKPKEKSSEEGSKD